jgi:hypothetical protein
MSLYYVPKANLAWCNLCVTFPIRHLYPDVLQCALLHFSYPAMKDPRMGNSKDGSHAQIPYCVPGALIQSSDECQRNSSRGRLIRIWS